MRRFHSCPPGAEQSDLVVRALEDFYRPLGESRERIEHLLRREKRLCAQAPELGEESPFFVVYGDNYLDCDLSRLWEFHAKHEGIASIALFEKEDVTGAGVVQLDENGRVVRFVEKPAPSQVFSRLVSGGVYVLSPEILPLIPDVVPCDFGFDVFPTLLAAGRVLFGHVMEGAVWPIDTPPLYQRLRERLGDGPS